MTGTLHEDLCIFMIISRAVLLRMRNISDKSCTENQNTFCVQESFFFFRKSCRLRDNGGKHGTVRQTIDYNIILFIRIA
jgi:hypothetical protein